MHTLSEAAQRSLPEVAEEHSNGQEAQLTALEALADGDPQSVPLEPPPATPTDLEPAAMIQPLLKRQSWMFIMLK
jgi:hypothetical protein